MDTSCASSACVRRRFLPWDAALLPQVVSWLAEGWSGDQPLDLSELLVIVPTRQSGRRLREALAECAARRGAAVFPPRVLLPEALVAPPPEGGAASRLESLLAWAQVFRELPLDDFREVLPVDPPVRNFAWALQLAEQFVRLQRTLAEAGWRLRDVAGRVGRDFPEWERWRQIGELEAQHEQRLRAAGREDAPILRIRQAQAPSLPNGVRRVVVLAVPDPQPIALRALKVLARTVPVEVVVYAPETEAASFDEWGRPRPDDWTRRALRLPGFAERIHVCADPEEQAAAVAALAAADGDPTGRLGIGVADPEVLPLLEGELQRRRLESFNPEGRPRHGDQLYQLLQCCAALVRDEAWPAVEALARCPDFLAFLQARLGAGFSVARFLRGLDALHTRHLPATLGDALAQLRRAPEPTVREGSAEPRDGEGRAQERASVAAALDVVAELRAALRTGEFPGNAAAVLAQLFAAREFAPQRPEDAAFASAAEAWIGVLQEVQRAREVLPAPEMAEAWELALRLYSENVAYEEKVDGALELQGWLELLWEEAPHLVVAGLNDGCVPEAVVGDPFLPESLRERLGLKTNAARLARDAYLLEAMAACRPAAGGQLDLILGKTSVAGDPLRPSRLLLRCADEELPSRVRLLFQPAESTRTTQPWRRAWRLRPRRVDPPARVAVTALRAWLACPFRFYLARVLRMEPVDPAKTELDVFDFGTLCHAALEAMGAEPALRDVTDAVLLREFLLQRLEREAARRFGRNLSLPLVVQLESARQRLARAAEVQAQSRSEGWVIEQVERPFEIRVGELVVAGKIDRIDRHERTGALRVLDYKTSDRPVDPETAHVRGARREETAPEFARWLCDGKPGVWTDLQLPLYRWAVQADSALAGAGVTPEPRQVDCGYFNLPKSVGETGIQPWADYTRELDAAAWRCALGVAQEIRAGHFWPPSEAARPEQDDFAALFHHGAAESIDWEAAR